MFVEKSLLEIFIDKCSSSMACDCKAIQLNEIDGGGALAGFEVNDHAAVRSEVSVTQMALDIRLSIGELVLQRANRVLHDKVYQSWPYHYQIVLYALNLLSRSASLPSCVPNCSMLLLQNIVCGKVVRTHSC